MDLISCDNCGVVLDRKKLNFPTDLYNVDRDIDLDKAFWDGDNYVAKILCPVCKSAILNN